MRTIRPASILENVMTGLLVSAFLLPPQLWASGPLHVQLIPGPEAIDVRLANTSSTKDYQVLSKTNLNAATWQVERQVPGLDGASTTILPTNRPPTVFYTAREIPAATNAGLVVRLGATNLSYPLGSPPLALGPAATVENAVHPTFAGGQFTLSFSANGDSDDRLAIATSGNSPGQINLNGNSVLFGGVSIGAKSGGLGLAPLQVVFNSNATAAAVTALLRALTFENRSLRYSRQPRTVRYDLTDGQGARSTPASLQVDVLCPDSVDAVIVLDVSFSLPPSAYLQMKQTAADLMSYLDPARDRAGLVTFYGGSTIVDPLTNDFARVRQDMVALPQLNGTELHGAISNAQHLLLSAPRNNSLRLMLILTDGEMTPRRTETNALAAATAAKAAGIRIVAAGFINSSGLVFNDFLSRIASSPDDYYAPDPSSNAPPIAVTLAAQLRSAARSFCRLPNAAPTALAQSISTLQDTPVSVTLAGTDPDGDALSFAIATGPAHGTLSGQAPRLIYTPAPGYFGPDQFQFKADDGLADSAPAAVAIDVVQVISPTCPLLDARDWSIAAAPPRAGSGNAAGSVRWNGCEMTLTEGDSFLVEAARPLTFPPFADPTGRLLLSLTYETPSFDSGATNRMRDAFEAALVDSGGRALAFTIQGADGVVPAGAVVPPSLPAFPDAFFNHSEGAAPFFAPGADAQSLPGGLNTLTVDVTALANSSGARLILRLVNNDLDRAGRVRVTDLQLRTVANGPSSPGSTPPAFSPLVGTGDAGNLASASACLPVMLAGTNPGGLGSNAVAGLGDAPSVDVSSPAPGAQLAVGPILLSGLARARAVTNSGPSSSPNRLAGVQIDGRPADALDAQGNFFAVIDLHAGSNLVEVVAFDSANRRTTNRVAVVGSQCAAALAGLGVVTPSAQPKYGRTSFNDWTRTLYADVALQNIGGYSMGAPLYVGVTRISDPSVSLLAADGRSAEGIPYYDLSAAVDSARLAPGQVSRARTLAFANPQLVPFTYELIVLARANQAPTFTRVPAVEAVLGQPYSSEAHAADPDGDAVTYALTVSPAGATIDSTSGILRWPSPGPGGSSAFEVQANDGRGGVATQRFVLSVAPSPGNRPPVFVSTPNVVAYVGSNYLYAAQATDPDGDVLTYAKAGGPPNLSVAPASGLVSWSPTVDQLGTNAVNLRVSDGHGGVASQVYDVIVAADPNNRSPVITSQPVPTFEFPTLGHGSQGIVAPGFLDLFLAEGDTYTGTAAISLPATNVLGGSADIAFVVDQSGSMAGEQTWIGDMLQSLDSALMARGIGPNRYALVGFPGGVGSDYTRTFPVLGGSWFVSIFGPDNAVVDTLRFDGASNPAEVVLPTNGPYRLLVFGDGGTNPVSYGLSYRGLTNRTSPLTLGAVVTGALSVPGQVDEYGFTLAERALVTFDSLTASSVLSWTLTGPGGVVVNGRRFDLSDSTDQSVPTLDLPAGSYALKVDGSGTAVGSYAFRLMNLAGATPLTPGVAVNGELNPPNATVLYRFVAGAGQRVYVDLRSLTGPATSSRWRLVGPAGQVLAVQTLGVDMETGPLTAGGVQTLMVEGRVNEVTNRLYTFNVEVLGTSGGQGIAAGQTVNGQINAAGQQQVYTFAVGQRSLWYLDVLSSNNANALTWTLTGPMGTNVNSRRWDQSDAGENSNPVLDLVAGNYRLTVDGTGDVTSPYAYRLLDLSNAQLIGAGSTVSGTLDPASATEVYGFAATPGERMIFDALTRTNLPNARWRLVGPSGAVLFNTLLSLDVSALTLTQLGDYRLLVEGGRVDAGLGAGTYEFRLIGTNSVPVAPLTGSPLTVGQRVDGELVVAGQTNDYAFTLTNRALVYVDALTNRSTVVWTLRGPHGSVVTGRRLDQTDSADQAAPVLDLVAGDYQMAVSATGTNVGTYAFKVLNLAQGAALTPGLEVNGELNPGTQTRMYRFAAGAGQRLYVDMVTLSGGATSSRWRLYDPYGQPSFNQVLGTDVETVGLTTSGLYTLLLEGRSTETNSRNYTLDVEVLTDGEQPLTLGQTTAGTIRVPGERDTYTFSLAERTMLYFDSLTPSNTLTWTLEGPIGTVINARRFDQSDSLDISSPALDLVTGDYRLTVDATGGGTGDYRFRLVNLASAPAIASGATVHGELNPPPETDFYRFAVPAQARLYLDQLGLSGGATSSRWRVLNPLGQVVADQRLDLDLEVAPLSMAGTYFLLVEGRVTEITNRTYDVIVQVLPQQSSPLTLGAVVTGALSVPGQVDEYGFTLAERALVTFDSLTASSVLSWTLTGPGGVVVNGRRFDLSDSTDQSVPTLDLPAGSYALKVDGSGTAVGSYAFRLMNLAGATPLTPGVAVNGELNPPNATVLYRFVAGAGQRVYVDLRSLTGPATSSRWRLVGPAGQVLAVQTLGVDMETGPLTAGGVQTLMVEGRVNEVTNRLYTFNVEVLGSTGGQEIAAGQTVNGQINVAGQQQVYTFAVGQRSLWYLDVLSSNNANALTWTLTGPMGTNVNSRRWDQSDAGENSNPVLDLVAGSYRLTVDATGDVTSPYAFRLLDLSSAQLISAGSTVSGTLSPASATDVYGFAAAPGDRMIFDALTRTNLPNARWRLVGPSGVVLFNTLLNLDVAALTLTQLGDYRLLVEGARVDAGLGAGTYEFRWIGTNSVPVAPLTGSPLTMGQRVDGELVVAGQTNEYAFTLTKRALVYVDALTNRSTVVWTLRGPHGAVVTGRRLDQTDSADQATPVLDLVAGEYQVAVSATGTNVGTYAFNVLNLAGGEALTPGIAISGELNPGTQTRMYRFAAGSGQRLYVDMETLSGGATSSRWRLYDPYGQQSFNQVLGTDVETVGLTTSGIYTLLLEGRSTETNSRNYTLDVEVLTDGEQPLTLGQTTAGTIRVPGERDTYTFSLAERTMLYFDSLTPSNTLTWTLEGPAGPVIGGRPFSSSDTAGPLLTLDLIAGDYRLTVDATGDNRLGYAFNLQPFQPLSPGVGPQVVSGFLESGRGSVAYAIDGVAGQTLVLDFDAQSGASFGSAALFVGASRLLVTSAGGTEDGYAGVATALRQLPFRSSAAANVILVTDENRDIVDTNLTLASIIAEARTNSVRINTVLDGLLQNNAGQPAIGLDSRLQAYTADGAGGFVISTNGTFIGPAVNDDAPENPLAEYVPLAWQTGGATWDLNQLREGGLTAVSFTKAFVDVNVESIELQLRLNLVASDPSLLFTNLSGVLEGIGSGDTATFSFRLVRSGDARAFALQFVRPGTTDVLASIPVRFRNEYSYQLAGYDPDGDRLRYTLVQGPPGATVDPNTGTLRWRPQTNESSAIVVRVDDGRGGFGFQEFTVSPASSNRPPQLAPVPFVAAAVDRLYTFNLRGADPDGDRLAYTLLAGPDGLALDADTGAIRWTPTAAQLGPQDIRAQVSDGRGGSAEQSWTVMVSPIMANADPEFTSQPPASALVGRAYVYQATAHDTNGDALTFDRPLGPDGLSVATNGLVVWVPRLDQAGTHDVLLRVRDAFGGVALQAYSVRVAAANTPPVFSSVPAGRAVVGVNYRQEVFAQDAEGQTLAFLLTSATPAGLVLFPHPYLPNAAFFDWIPTTADLGTHRVELMVFDSDGASAPQAFDLTVVAAAPDSPPSFVSRARTSARVGLLYACQIEATDPDPDALTFELVQAPPGMTLSDAPAGTLRSALLQWTPPALGAYPVAVTVSDGRPGGVVTQQFVLNVVSSLQNEAPQIVSSPPGHAAVHELYAYDLQANDPEGDAVTWRLVSGPAGLSLDPILGTLRWTPTVEQLGASEVTVEAQDLYLATATQTFSVSVELANRPPRITSTPPVSAQTGEPFFYAATGSDPDGDTLRWSLTQGPPGLAIDAATGLVRWLPATNQVGTFVVTLAVNDGRGGTASQSFSLFASNLRANRAPVVIGNPLRDATIGRPFTYNFQATDSDGDTLSVQSMLALPAGATFVPAGSGKGVLSWTPGAGQAGRHEFALEARDPAGAAAAQRFFVTVRSNAFPSIVSSPPTNAVPNLPYRYDVRAVDADGDALTYSLVTGPAGLTLDEIGRVVWVPAVGQAGLHNVSLSVADGFGGTALQTFAIGVAADTEPPTVRLNIAYNLSDSAGRPFVRVGTEVAVRVEAADNVGVVARELSVGGASWPVGPDGSALATFPTIGTIEAIARATDASGNSASVTNSITVVDPDAASTVAIVIHSPTNTAEISGLVPVVATITSDVAPLSEYLVEVAEWNLDEVALETALSDSRLRYTVLTNVALPPGTVGLTNAQVARFDPTLLLNGAYLIRVTAFDANRQGHREGVVVNVTGSLKFGEFRLEFTDLRVPLAGIPITLKRVYDSRTSRKSGDFGYGWSLGVQDAGILEIGKSRFYGLGMEETTFTSKTRVYLTAPDGRRIGFSFAPELGAISLIFGAYYRPAFRADPGVTDWLEPIEAPAAYQYNGAGQFVTGFGLVGYNPSAYRLITRDNLTYVYDQNLGLRRVTDLNGNRLEYTRDGIFHYLANTTTSDQSIRFVRDAQGRITDVIDGEGHVQRYTYDSAGDLRAFADVMTNVTRYAYHPARAHYLTSITDPLGRDALRLDYDNQGRLLGVIDSLGQRIEQEFDADAKTGTITDPNGTTTVSTYDDSGNEIRRVVQGVSTNRFEYDANQRLTRSIDARGYVTQRSYDPRGNITNIVDALGQTTSIRYNDKNRPIRVTDALGAATYFNLNAKGQMTNVVNALGGHANFERDDLGRVRTIRDFNGHTTTYEYDGGCACGRPSRVIQPDGASRSYEYGALGRTTRETDELGHTRNYVYDAAGRMTELREADGGVIRYAYNAAQKIRETDSLGRTTSYGYDSADRLVAITNALGGVTRFEYGLGTNRTAVIDPSGNVTRFRYDLGNRVSQQIDPWGRTNLFAYDAVGNLVESIDRNGRRRTFSYDGLNRRTAEVWWQGAVAIRTQAFSFNAIGAMSGAEDPAGRLDFEYDLLNRLTRATQSRVGGLSNFALTYAYDGMDNELSVTDASGVQVTAEFDARSRMTRRIWQGGGLPASSVQFELDAAGNRTNLVRYADASGQQRIGQSRYAYNAVDVLTEISHIDGAGGVLAAYRYQRDSAQQVSERLLNGQTTRYRYDLSGQLTNAVYSSGQGEEVYRYDANGNRVGGSAVVTTNNQVTADSLFSYTYDGEGNLISRQHRITGATTTYQYDHRNRLINVADADAQGARIQTVDFTYDALNRRISKSVNGVISRFLFNRDQVWADANANGTITARYFLGSRMDEMLARYWPGRGVDWYLTDNLGTVRDVASAVGSLVNHIEYDSFGRVLAQSAAALGDRFLFTGREFDAALGFYFCRARYYDPAQGRFISADPISFAAGDFNLYRYVGNNPISASDPTGLAASIEYAMLIGAITGALLAPTFDIICKISLGQAGDITVGREIKKSVVGAIIGAIAGGLIAYAALELMLATIWAEGGALDGFLFNQALKYFIKSQTLIKVPTIGLTSLGAKIFLFHNCDFLQVVSAGF